jgi:hypothetical protein
VRRRGWGQCNGSRSERSEATASRRIILLTGIIFLPGRFSEVGLRGWTGAERKAGPEQEGGNDWGPGYTLLCGGTRRVSLRPARPSYAQDGAVTTSIRSPPHRTGAKRKAGAPKDPGPAGSGCARRASF